MDNTGKRNVPANTFNEIRKRAIEELTSVKKSLQSKRRQKILLNLEKEQNCLVKVRRRVTVSPSRKTSKAVPALGETSIKFEPTSAPPSGIQWVRAQTNVRLPEGFEPSFFIPYVDEKEENILSSTVVADELYEADSDNDDESDVEGKEIDGNDGGNLRDRRPSSRMMRFGRRKIGESRWDRAAKRIALNHLYQQMGSLTAEPAVKAISKAFGFSNSSYVKKYIQLIEKRQECWSKKKKDDLQLKSSRKEVLDLVRGGGVVTASQALQGDSITFFFCRQCYIYDCSLHGQQVSGPTCSIPDKTRRDSAPKHVSDEMQSRCLDLSSDNCWHLSAPTTDNDPVCTKWWSQFEKSSSSYADDLKAILNEVLPIYGEDFCRVSKLVRVMLRDTRDIDILTCKRMGHIAKTCFNNLLTKPESSRCKPVKNRAPIPAAESKAMNGGKRPDFTPCRHDGPCSSRNCSCVQTGVHCEKYCGCNHNRPNQPRNAPLCSWAFKGCSCKSAVACVSKACICFSWKRECDPDLCKACHDCKSMEGGYGSISCRNIGLQHFKGRRIVAGRSDVHGWGVFATIDVARNELVGEYVGEVIEDQDAERRGRVYDLLNSNFLFDITTKYSLDSSRIGNKLRYCNHSSDPNCEPRLMRVGGDIRIGIFAKRDIRKHEELFFNYGPNFVKQLELKEKLGSKGKRKASNIHHSDLYEDDNDGDDYYESDSDEADHLPLSAPPIMSRGSQGGSANAIRRSSRNSRGVVKTSTNPVSGIEKNAINVSHFESHELVLSGNLPPGYVRTENGHASSLPSNGLGGTVSQRLRSQNIEKRRQTNGSIKLENSNGKQQNGSQSPCKDKTRSRTRDGNDDDDIGGREDDTRAARMSARLAPSDPTTERKIASVRSNSGKHTAKRKGISYEADERLRSSGRLTNDIDLRRSSVFTRTSERRIADTTSIETAQNNFVQDSWESVKTTQRVDFSDSGDPVASGRNGDGLVDEREKGDIGRRSGSTKLHSKTNLAGDFSKRLKALKDSRRESASGRIVSAQNTKKDAVKKSTYEGISSPVRTFENKDCSLVTRATSKVDESQNLSPSLVSTEQLEKSGSSPVEDNEDEKQLNPHHTKDSLFDSSGPIQRPLTRNGCGIESTKEIWQRSSSLQRDIHTEIATRKRFHESSNTIDSISQHDAKSREFVQSKTPVSAEAMDDSSVEFVATTQQETYTFLGPPDTNVEECSVGKRKFDHVESTKKISPELPNQAPKRRKVSGISNLAVESTRSPNNEGMGDTGKSTIYTPAGSKTQQVSKRVGLIVRPRSRGLSRKSMGATDKTYVDPDYRAMFPVERGHRPTARNKGKEHFDLPIIDITSDDSEAVAFRASCSLSFNHDVGDEYKGQIPVSDDALSRGEELSLGSQPEREDIHVSPEVVLVSSVSVGDEQIGMDERRNRLHHHHHRGMDSLANDEDDRPEMFVRPVDPEI